MNRSLILTLAAAVPAHVACAQTWDWLATVDNPVLDPSEGVTTQTVTLSVAMVYDTPFYILGAAIFDTLGALNADYGQITDWKVLNNLADLTGDLTTTDGVSLYNTNAGQICATFGPCTTGNPIDVLEFTWQLNDDVELDAPVEVNYVTLTRNASIMAGQDQNDHDVIPVETIIEAFVPWTILPAPSALALAALTAPTLVRRPRRKDA
jgi:hypothetical protein